MASILVVCTGNLCRSPFAESVLRGMLTERFGPPAPTVSSVGTIARDGTPATREAIVVASEHGIDASSHAARRLAREHLADADLVLAMTAEHRAVAWELAAWWERLVRGVFGTTAGASPRRAEAERPRAAGSPPAP